MGIQPLDLFNDIMTTQRDLQVRFQNVACAWAGSANQNKASKKSANGIVKTHFEHSINILNKNIHSY